MTRHEETTLLTVEEVAKRLTLSLRTVRGLIQAGDLPAIRLGARRIAIKAADLAEFVEARRRTADAESIAR